MAKTPAKKTAKKKVRSLYSPETFKPVKVEETDKTKLKEKRRRLKEKR